MLAVSFHAEDSGPPAFFGPPTCGGPARSRAATAGAEMCAQVVQACAVPFALSMRPDRGLRSAGEPRAWRCITPTPIVASPPVSRALSWLRPLTAAGAQQRSGLHWELGARQSAARSAQSRGARVWRPCRARKAVRAWSICGDGMVSGQGLLCLLAYAGVFWQLVAPLRQPLPRSWPGTKQCAPRCASWRGRAIGALAELPAVCVGSTGGGDCAG